MDDDIKKESPELMHGKEEWLDKHGRPTFEYLNSLVEDGNPRALEVLMTIADQHDVSYNEETSPQELVDQIMLVLNQED
ncbi:hypothetical protein IT402_02560 [Candidatus Nomurabacteria bacterium]|nr:hypothetical protein [Candidatus Nomurabacteria bacterium]